MVKIYLKSGKEQSLRRFHPWVFSGAIKKTEGNPAEGDLVEIYSSDNQYLATGHYQVGSITVRILSFQNETIDDTFWNNRISAALELRHKLQLAESSHTNVYRLVHGEGDGLPGLIVDIYNRTAVIQTHSVGMYRNREQIARVLMDLYRNRLEAVYDKSEASLPFKAQTGATNGYLIGNSEPAEVLENDLRFHVDWVEGQKTGFFIDQRENRKLVETYANQKKVLNVFGYTGGFSVYALKGGATLVHSVDSSAKAIELTRKNVSLNFQDAPHEAHERDAFGFLNQTETIYDLIILDPPAFAKHLSALKNALQAYKRLNAKAISNIAPGGMLFTFSCSQVVTREQFRQAVFSGAAISGRKVRILHQLSQPADHPVNIYHPESEYLKGLVLYVE